jgi:hypothetical protein
MQQVADAVAEGDPKRLERVGVGGDAIRVRVLDARTLALAASAQTVAGDRAR